LQSFPTKQPRHSSPVVSVYLLGRMYVCTARASPIINSSSDVWCASRVSVWSPVIHFVHRRSDDIDRGQRFFTTSVYADDTQMYGSCRPVEIDAFSAKLSECIGVVSNWMRSNRLQLNSDKTEVLWRITGRRQHQLPTTALSIDGVQVSPVTSIRNLGIFIDSDLVKRSHVQRTVSGCFAALRQLCQIRNSVPKAAFVSLVVALVLSRLDYGNSALVGLPIHLVRCLQSVHNAAARLICRRRFDHVTDALVSLHWLRVAWSTVSSLCWH